MLMASLRILHIVGEKASPFLLHQVEAQARLLPAAMFEQAVAAGETSTVRLAERILLRRTEDLKRRFGSDFVASRRLRRVIAEFRPKLAVCWDLAAAEQLRLALSGTRFGVKGVLMLFGPVRSASVIQRLRSNVRGERLHVLAYSDVLAEHLRGELGTTERVHALSPFCGHSGRLDRQAVRRQMGLAAEAPVVFMSDGGRIDDRILGLWGAAVAQKLHPRLRVVIPTATMTPKGIARCRHFAEGAVGGEIVRFCDAWQARAALSAADVCLEPATQASESLAVVSAFADGVPVAATEAVRYGAGGSASELVMRIEKANARTVAAAVLRLIEDGAYRDELVGRAREWAEANGSELRYRGDLVRIYQQILQREWQVTV